MCTNKIEASVVTTGAEESIYHNSLLKSYEKISNDTLSHKFLLKNNSYIKGKKELTYTKAKEQKEMEEKLGYFKVIVILLILIIFVLTGISLYIIYKEPNNKK